jgi:hypothetical protein
MIKANNLLLLRQNPRQRITPYANRKAHWLIAHHQVSQSPQTTTKIGSV